MARGRNQIREKAMYSGSSYVAGKNDRIFKNWTSHDQGPDQGELELPTLRARSLELLRNSPIGRGIIYTIVNNSIGSGLKPQFHLNREVLKLTEKESKEKSRELEKKFDLWAKSKVSTDAKFDFYRLQYIYQISKLSQGEIFTIFPRIKGNRNNIPLTINLIEANRICQPYGEVETDRFRSGIELNKYGRPIYYNILKNSPNSSYWKTKDQFARVEAYNNTIDTDSVLHDGIFERPGQLRGIPLLSPVATEIKLITEALKNDSLNYELASKFTVFIKSPQQMESVFSKDQNTRDSDDPDYERDYYELGAGAIMQLEEGEEIQIADPKQPNTSSGEFTKHLIGIAGMGLTIPLEVLIKQFTSSYSASRASLIEAWTYFMIEREITAKNFCQKVAENWLIDQWLTDNISLPGFDDPEIRKYWSNISWIGSAKPQIDPVKEANAAEKRLKLSLTTLSEETAALTGKDWDEVAEKRSEELKKQKKLGLSTVYEKPIDPNFRNL